MNEPIKPFQVPGELDPRFVIHVQSTGGSGSIAVGGAVGFPVMDFFEVHDSALAAEIAKRWNAFHPLQEENTRRQNEILALESELAETKQILYDTEYGDDL